MLVEQALPGGIPAWGPLTSREKRKEKARARSKQAGVRAITVSVGSSDVDNIGRKSIQRL